MRGNSEEIRKWTAWIAAAGIVFGAAAPCRAEMPDAGTRVNGRAADRTADRGTDVQQKQSDGMDGKENTEETEYISEIDFEELWETNEEVIGWIRIEDTCIDYPILYDPDGNEKYLHYDMEGNESVYGEIFLDWEDEPDFSSYHNVIYGHHMRDGSMFKGITYFKDMDYWEDHAITLFLPEKKIELTPFACMVTNSDAIRRKTEFEDEEELQEYILEMTEGAETIEMPEEEITRVYSFVTCSYEFEDARTFLYCYEKQEEGEE